MELLEPTPLTQNILMSEFDQRGASAFLAAKQQLYNLESWLIDWLTDSPLALELVIPVVKTPKVVRDSLR